MLCLAHRIFRQEGFYKVAKKAGKLAKSFSFSMDVVYNLQNHLP